MFFPQIRVGTSVTMSYWITMYTYHSKPFQIVLIFITKLRIVYYVTNLFFGNIPYCIRKITLKVYLYDTCRLGESFSNLKDMFHQLIDSFLTTHSLAIVVGVWREYLFRSRYYYFAYFVVNHTTTELGSKYLSPTRARRKKGIIPTNTESPVIALIHSTD